MIEICVCTFRRASLAGTLHSLGKQVVPEGITLRLIVADNDETPSAQDLVTRVAQDLPFPVQYVHAPSRNISLARNACLDAATGDFLAFIDDDELAPPDWIADLYALLAQGPYDAVFGPAMAEYPETAPNWIKQADYHSNVPTRRNGTVQTGHTCNALIRTNAPSFSGQRFLLEKGRTGGEDTEFFFRAWRAGARFAISEDAKVYEPVDPARLAFRWIAKRKFRSGITYGRLERGRLSLAKAAVSLCATILKIAYCILRAVLAVFSSTKRNFWLLRAVFHAGVITSILSVKEQELYG
ncbi:MAG: glycosyltransferase family 2 protein [Hyphomonas oceanitis]|uniref:glycosyltransferase family 2 protein n=1 Tax=Hyphomonas oceanitis TaxID=81033 RepID=UPI003001A18D